MARSKPGGFASPRRSLPNAGGAARGPLPGLLALTCARPLGVSGEEGPHSVISPPSLQHASGVGLRLTGIVLRRRAASPDAVQVLGIERRRRLLLRERDGRQGEGPGQAIERQHDSAFLGLLLFAPLTTLAGFRLLAVDDDRAAETLADGRTRARRVHADDDLVAGLKLFLGPALPDHDARAVQFDRIVPAPGTALPSLR